MSDLHDLLVAESERLQPVSTPAFDALAGRAHRRHITRLLVVAGAVVAIVAGTTGVVLGTRHGDGGAAVASAGPLISRGDCAGLTVTAELVGRPGRWPVQAGDQSRPIAMPPNYLMWLRATGPCVQRLRISASNDLIQTATGGITNFNDQGIGIIVSNERTGDATVHLALTCADDPRCPAGEIATIPITITEQATTPNPSATATATASPAPTDTPVNSPSPSPSFAALQPPAPVQDHGEPQTFFADIGAGAERLALVDSQSGAIKRWVQQQGSQSLLVFSGDLATAYHAAPKGCGETWTKIDTATGATSPAFANLGDPHEVALTPDGSRIAFVRLTGANLRVGCPTGTSSLVVEDLATGESRSWVIGAGEGEALYPAFDPTGRRLAFVRHGRVWLLDINTDATLDDAAPLSAQEPPPGCRQTEPKWRPGANVVLVAQECSSSVSIVGYDADTGAETYRHDIAGTDPFLAYYDVDASGQHIIYALSGTYGQVGGRVYAVEPAGDRHIVDDAYEVVW